MKEYIFDLLTDHHPMTVRQVFYRLVVADVIEKTEAEYKGTVCRLLAVMRRKDELPFDWIADNTRFMRKPRTYRSLREMLELTQETYRRALWGDQDAYVEIWCEKDALTGVLWKTTAAWDVPLMISRGFASLSFIHGAAETIKELGKSAYIYYFGDHDPSGVHIDRAIERGLREYAPHAEIHFNRVAVLPEQIDDWDLPTRPTKTSDTRSKSFEGESVEVDAIPPQQLIELAESCIVQHIDADRLKADRRTEKLERETLDMMVDDLDIYTNMARDDDTDDR